jgi:hypothetical protein
MDKRLSGECVMLWIGIIIGLFLGANVAIFILGLCISADKADNFKKVSNR